METLFPKKSGNHCPLCKQSYSSKLKTAEEETSLLVGSAQDDIRLMFSAIVCEQCKLSSHLQTMRLIKMAAMELMDALLANAEDEYAKSPSYQNKKAIREMSELEKVRLRQYSPLWVEDPLSPEALIQ